MPWWKVNNIANTTILCPKVQSSTSLIYAIELKQLSLRSDMAAWSEQGSKRNQMNNKYCRSGYKDSRKYWEAIIADHGDRYWLVFSIKRKKLVLRNHCIFTRITRVFSCLGSQRFQPLKPYFGDLGLNRWWSSRNLDRTSGKNLNTNARASNRD